MVRVILVAWIGAVGLLSWPLTPVHAQPAPARGVTTTAAESRPIRPRTALQQGLDLYLKGEYEAAEPLLRLAEAARTQLTAPEQAKLDEYLKKNSDAMQARFQALEQLSKADEAIQTGRYQDAGPLLQALKSSKYLTAKERQQVNSLSDQHKQKAPRSSWLPSGGFLSRTKPAQEATAKPDPDALLAEARKAFERKQYDQAEASAKESEAAGYHAIFPWSDTPAKLLKEVQTARAKLPASTPMSPGMAETKPGLAPMPRVFDSKPAVAPKMAEVPSKPAPMESTDKKSGTARELLRQAHLAVVAGDLAKARKLVKEAEDTKAHIPWWEEHTPDKVKNEIARAEQAGVKPTTAPGKPTADVSVNSQKPMTSAEVKTLVKEARKALDDNRLDQAEEMAKRARLVPGVKWGLFEDTPDKVMADVAKAKESSNSDRATTMLTEARRMIDKGQLDEAEKLTYQAEALRSSYPIWYRGERPDRMRTEIASKRKTTTKPSLPPLLDPVAKKDEKKPATPSAMARTDSPLYGPPPPAAQANQTDPRRQQAVQLMAQARANLNKGDYVTALNQAAQVKSMNVTFQAGEDSPESIVAAVRAVQNQQNARQNPQVAEAARKKALQHLADARLMMKEDRLLDALQAVKQAQECGAIYQPNDDLPETVMTDLKKAATMQVEKYSAAAQTLSSYRRHQDAERYWGYVQQVATAFQMDTATINQKLGEAKQLASGQPVETPMPAAAPSVVASQQEEAQGKELLAQAETELKRGEIAQARKLAEALYTGPFAMKDQARKLLAQIDDAEYKQTVKRSEMLYEQAVRSFMRKDYQVCASYLQSLDLKLLDERKRAHTQEILASREMQPHAIVPTGVQEDSPGAAKATVSDQPKAPAVGEKPSPSLLAEVQKRQEIALQRLREEQLQSERDAGKLANQGDYAGAVKRLETALAAVRESGLDAEVTAAMQRRLDQRKKQYQTMSEQVAFAELQKDKMNANNEYNRKKFLFEEHKREQVADFMKQYNEAYKAGKYKDAAAFAMKAKEIDPDNPAAEVAAFKADVMRNLASDDRIKQAKAGGFADNIQDVARASIPPAESELPMSYGDKDQWFNKDKRKNKAALSVRQMSPQDKEVANLLNTVVSVDFKNKPLSEALDALREMTGVNIVPDKTFIDQDGIVMDQPVTMPLDRLPLRTVLRLMLQNCRLTYVIKDGVVLVTTPAGERGKMTEVIYPVADLVVQTDRDYPGDPVNQLVGKNNSQDNPYSQNLTWNKNTSPGDLAGGYTPGGGMGTQVPGKPGSMGQKSMVQILMELIRNTIEPGSWRDMGGSGHIDFYPVGMSLVVSQTPDIQEQIQLLLDRLRELQQLQVTVEVRFITLSENFYERIGVDMDFQFNDNQTKFAKQVVASAFAPPSVPNEPSHLDNVIVGLTPQGVFTNDLDIPVNVSSFERAALPSGFAGFPGQPGGNGGIDLGVAFLSSIEVFLFLEAAQGDIRSNVLTAPKITLFNGQTATLSSSLTQFLVLEVIPIRDPLTGLITFFPVNTPVPSTTTLTVTAIVSADRRYVTLSINPVITRIVNSSRTFSPVAGIVLQQPDIESLTVFTAVSVPDGGTILLGGIKNMNEQRLEFGPPILSKIPYVNRLFRNQSFGREARSLMIMVTPRIIIPEEEEEKLGQTFAF